MVIEHIFSANGYFIIPLNHNWYKLSSDNCDITWHIQVFARWHAAIIFDHTSKGDTANNTMDILSIQAFQSYQTNQK